MGPFKLDSTYKIDTDSFEAAVAMLVLAFKAANPGIGSYQATLHDGSKLKLTISRKQPKVRPCAGDTKSLDRGGK